MTPTDETKPPPKPTRKRKFDRLPGPSILEGLGEVFAQTYGKNVRARTPRQYVDIPER